jgi:hypothetical protein
MSIWAITSYYNPSGYKVRLRNFKAFHANFGLPLVVAELVLPGVESELSPYLSQFDANSVIHIVIREGDVMWQKERLLNVALAKVPQGASCVVWADCDVLFRGRAWIDSLSEALRLHPIVQCFNRAQQLLAQALTDSGELLRGFLDVPHTENFWAREKASCMHEYLCTGRVTSSCTGLIWAGRADLLRRHGFYDAQIIGSGDEFFVRALLGAPIEASGPANLCRYSEVQVRHYEAWAKPFNEELSRTGSVGCLDQTVYHLWHGQVENRKYVARHHLLAEHEYDPSRDIRINGQGAWSWNSDKPRLHKALKDYFQGRQEDGVSALKI